MIILPKVLKLKQYAFLFLKKIQYDTQAKDTVITQIKVDVSNDPSSI